MVTKRHRCLATALAIAATGSILPLPAYPVSAATEAELPADLPRLTGILLSDHRKAIFQSEDEPPQVVEEGGLVGDWHVVRIDRSSLTLSDGKNTYSLAPRGAPHPVSPIASAAGDASSDDLPSADPQRLEDIFRAKKAEQPVIDNFEAAVSALAAE